MSQFEEVREGNFWNKISKSLFDHKLFNQNTTNGFNNSKNFSSFIKSIPSNNCSTCIKSIPSNNSTRYKESQCHFETQNNIILYPKTVSVELTGNKKNSKDQKKAESVLYTVNVTRETNWLCSKSLIEHHSNSKREPVSLDFNIRVCLPGEIFGKSLAKDVQCKCKHSIDKLNKKCNEYSFKGPTLTKPCSVVLHKLLENENSSCQKQTKIDQGIRFKLPYNNSLSVTTSKVLQQLEKPEKYQLYQIKKPKVVREPKLKLHRIEDSVSFCKSLNLKPVWKNDSLYKPPVNLKKYKKLRSKMSKRV